jgi:uncharacterized delta-60 repeat protein
LDPAFRANSAFDGDVVAAVVQNDGKIVVAGNFTIAGSEPRGRIARLNADGTLDASFGAGLSGVTNNCLTCVAVQNDGKILIGGSFSFVNGLPCRFVGRLNTNGSLDTNFEAALNNSVNAIVLQNDGRILIGGSFTTVDGTPRGRVARLKPDGTLDTTFGTGLPGMADGAVMCLSLQEDGRLIAGGSFTTVNGISRNRITRFMPDGALDGTFLNELGGANNAIHTIAIQTDSKILIGGSFTNVNGATRNRIARLNTDGSRDTSFGVALAEANSDVRSVVAQDDGKVLIGGLFTTLNGETRNRVARLNNDGSLDSSFGSSLAGMNSAVLCMVLTATGKVVVGGSFTTAGNLARNFITRLEHDGSSARMHERVVRP